MRDRQGKRKTKKSNIEESENDSIMATSKVVSSFQPLTPPPGDISAILRGMEKRAAGAVTTNLPAMVLDFDRSSHIVKVLVLVKTMMANGEALEPVECYTTAWRPQSGGFIMDFPIRPGDVGWIISADKDTTLVKQMNNKVEGEEELKQNGEQITYGQGNQGPQNPNTYMRHSITHGFFIPDCWAKIVGPKKLDDALVIQNIDENANLEKLNDAEVGRIAIHRDGNVDIDGARLKVDARTQFTKDIAVAKDAEIGGDVKIGDYISISPKDVPYILGHIKLRKVRYLERLKNHTELVSKTMYVLATDPMFNINEILPENNTIIQGGGGGGGGIPGVEFTSSTGVTSTTGVRDKFTLGHANDSNVQFSLNQSTGNIQIGVYYT